MMPVFDFKCSDCDRVEERYIDNGDVVRCSVCGEKMEKQLSCPYVKSDTRGMFGRSVMGEAEIRKDGSFKWKRKPALKKEEVGGDYRTIFDMKGGKR